jgi:hypothetical protein
VAHNPTCRCDRCEGIRRYPREELCDWCNKVHVGDANNCEPDNTEELELPEDTLQQEKIFWHVSNSIKKITEEVKQMIPTGNNQPQQSNTRTTSRTGLPYIAEANQHTFLTTDPQTAKIIDCRVNAEQRNPLTLKIVVAGKQFLWGINPKNPNWNILLEAYGNQENDWVGKQLGMYLAEDSFTGRIWPHVDPSYIAPTAARKVGK